MFAVFAFLAVFGVGLYDSGAISQDGIDFNEVRNGSNGLICEAIDTKVLGYDGSRCEGGN